MSITQDRLKALADAGDSLAKSYFFLTRQIEGLVTAYNRGEQPLQPTLEAILLVCMAPEATIARELILINKELAWWQFSHVKNTQERNRLARKRAGLPAKPRQITNELALKLSAQAEKEWHTPVQQPPTHGQPGQDPDAELLDDELQIETGEPTPTEYIPGELSAETKAELDREAEVMAARIVYEEQYGTKETT